MRSVLPPLLLLLVGLAGCSGGGGGGDAEGEVFDELDLEATSSTGVIRGVVVDEAIRPLANATVTLRMQGGADRTGTSLASGAFAFDGLAPGSYFLTVTKAGYLPSQSSTDVVAGVSEPPIVKVVLAPDASFVSPFFEQFVFEGFIECSMGVHTPVTYAYLSACSASGDVFPNDNFAHSDVVAGYPDFLQCEMVWDSTQSVSNWLAHNIYYPDPDAADGNADQAVMGPSPLVNSMDNATAKEYLEGLDYEEGADLELRQRIFTRADNGLGPGATVQQRFTVYATLFYGYRPPDGWTFIASGEVPPAPA